MELLVVVPQHLQRVVCRGAISLVYKEHHYWARVCGLGRKRLYEFYVYKD